AGDDFRGRGRTAVYQDDQRLAVDEVAGRGVEMLHLTGVAAADRNDLAAGQEGPGDPHGLVQETARVVAQVDDVAAEVVGRNGRGNGLDSLLEVVRDLAAELADPHVADVAAHDLMAHRADPDDLAHQGDGDRRILPPAHDLQAHLGAGL